MRFLCVSLFCFKLRNQLYFILPKEGDKIYHAPEQPRIVAHVVVNYICATLYVAYNTYIVIRCKRNISSCTHKMFSSLLLLYYID